MLAGSLLLYFQAFLNKLLYVIIKTCVTIQPDNNNMPQQYVTGNFCPTLFPTLDFILYLNSKVQISGLIISQKLLALSHLFDLAIDKIK